MCVLADIDEQNRKLCAAFYMPENIKFKGSTLIKLLLSNFFNT